MTVMTAKLFYVEKCLPLTYNGRAYRRLLSWEN